MKCLYVFLFKDPADMSNNFGVTKDAVKVEQFLWMGKGRTDTGFFYSSVPGAYLSKTV